MWLRVGVCCLALWLGSLDAHAVEKDHSPTVQVSSRAVTVRPVAPETVV